MISSSVRSCYIEIYLFNTQLGENGVGRYLIRYFQFPSFKYRTMHLSRSLRIARAYHTFSSFSILPEVREALERKGPVVALESTIVSHGKLSDRSVWTRLILHCSVPGIYRHAISTKCRDCAVGARDYSKGRCCACHNCHFRWAGAYRLDIRMNLDSFIQ